MQLENSENIVFCNIDRINRMKYKFDDNNFVSGTTQDMQFILGIKTNIAPVQRKKLEVREKILKTVEES